MARVCYSALPCASDGVFAFNEIVCRFTFRIMYDFRFAFFAALFFTFSFHSVSFNFFRSCYDISLTLHTVVGEHKKKSEENVK